MILRTSAAIMLADVVAAVEEVEKRENGRKVVLAGHSAGGGTAQLLLNNGRVKAQALALICSISDFGS
jgi:alpha-beta hydrolase superfamily lysophospholipase